jgi:hypothetical protein
VLVSAPASQTAGRLFAINPDVVELLAVVALGKSSLGSISLHPDSNVEEAWQTENFPELAGSRWRYSTPSPHWSSQSQSHIATDSQSVSLGVEPQTRYLLLFNSYALVFVGRPL